MKDKDYIKDLFSEKLSNHEVPVRSDLWSGIQSQIGSTAATATAKGVSLVTKIVAGLSAVAVVTGTIVWFSSDADTIKNANKEKARVASEKEKVESIQEFKNEEGAIPKNEQSVSIIVPDAFINKQNNKETPDNKITNELSMEVPRSGNIYQSPESVIAEPLKENKTITPVFKVEENPVKTGTKTNEGSEDVLDVEKTAPGRVEEWAKTNIFSPNNDGINDSFFLKTNNLKEFSITILNEKNQIVFQSQDAGFKWDGIDVRTGEMVPAGNYGYVIFATDLNGNPIKIFNTLNVSK